MNCECDNPGKCHRHAAHPDPNVRVKTDAFWIRCQTRPDYACLWDRECGLECDMDAARLLTAEKHRQWPVSRIEQRQAGTPCIYRGEKLRTEMCPTCAGRIELLVYGCDKFGECTLGKPLGDKKCCATCAQYKPPGPLKPLWTKRIDGQELGGNELQFNCSAILYQGRRLMAYRDRWGAAEIKLTELDGDWNPTWVRQLRIPRHQWNNAGREDPRLFVFRGEPYVAYIGVEVNRHQDMITHQCLAKLDANFNVQWTCRPEYANRNYWEKNWGFFEYDNELYAVYSIVSHRILKIDLEANTATEAYETENKMPWKHGLARGGASPVLHNGEWFSFFHGVESAAQRFYAMGLYTFENKPPFRPNCIIPEALLEADASDRPALHVPLCVYPCGAIHTAHQWIISYGYFDKWSQLISFDTNQITDCLQAIPGGPVVEVGPYTFRRTESLAEKIKPYCNPADAVFHPNLSGNYREWYASYASQVKPKRVLEIGVCRGLGCIGLLLGFEGIEEFVLFDNEAESPLNVAVVNIHCASSKARISATKADTQTLATLGDIGLFDLIHVDGDHTRTGCLHDLRLVEHHLAADGLIVVDDASSPDVAQAVKDFGWPAVFVPTTTGHALLLKPAAFV